MPCSQKAINFDVSIELPPLSPPPLVKSPIAHQVVWAWCLIPQSHGPSGIPNINQHNLG